MDANLAASIITALVALIAVLATAIFVSIRRGGNGSEKRGNDIIELFRQSTVSITQLASNQSQIVATQSEIIRGQERIVNQIQRLVDTHVKIEGSLRSLDQLVEQRRQS